jgi:hypothetical protein
VTLDLARRCSWQGSVPNEDHRIGWDFVSGRDGAADSLNDGIPVILERALHFDSDDQSFAWSRVVCECGCSG